MILVFSERELFGVHSSCSGVVNITDGQAEEYNSANGEKMPVTESYSTVHLKSFSSKSIRKMYLKYSEQKNTAVPWLL